MKKSKFILFALLAISLTAIYVTACKKEQSETNLLKEPSSEVLFERSEIERLLTADAKVAGLCFMPQKDQPTQLIARPFYWENDNLKPVVAADGAVPTANGARLNSADEGKTPGKFLFELAYVPKEEISRMLAYTGASSDLPIEGLRVKSLYTQKPERIFSGEVKDFQTLICMPYRKSEAFGQRLVNDREATSYYMSWPCPPFWRQD